MSEMRLTGLWEQTLKSADKLEKGAFLEAVDEAIAREAMLMVQLTDQSFRKQGLRRRWHPLSQVTLALRKEAAFGGTKILQASGSLKRSVTARKLGKRKWFVGVHRSVRVKRGKKSVKLMNIAAVHEGPFPTLIPCDRSSDKGQKVRKFFMALFLQGIIEKPLKSNRSVLVIMPRPFLAPAFEMVSRDSGKRVVKHIRDKLKDQGVTFA